VTTIGRAAVVIHITNDITCKASNHMIEKTFNKVNS
jgi:hypothetical protein